MSNELTKDRVERAIKHYKQLIAWTYSDGDRSDTEMEDAIIAETALAALDAVRWRDMADEQPTGDDEYPVLVKLKHAVLPEVMYYVPESGCAAFWRREYHYVTDELVSTDSIWRPACRWRYVDKWLPLPKWED